MSRKGHPGSALSDPRNFIAEGRVHRLYRRNRQVVWATAAVTCIGASAALSIASYRHAHAPPPPVADVPRANAAKAPAEPRPPWVEANFDLGVSSSGKPPERSVTQPILTRSPPPPPSLPPTIEASLQDPPAGNPPTTNAPPAPEAAGPTEPQATSPPRTDTLATRGEEAGSALAQAKPPPLHKADRFLRRGQYTVARYIYRDVYERGDAKGALGMARSYDAAHLREIGVRSKGNPEKAQAWYRKASEMDAARGHAGP